MALVAVIIAVAFIFTIFLFNDEKKVLDSKEREIIGGDFCQLSDGHVYYQVSGNDSDPQVILVHGFSTPSFIWDALTRDLVDSGYRVLRYDLYGRGYSDRPKKAYDSAFFERQLIELIEKVGIDKKNHLVGLSMGGAISTHFAASHPQLINSLTLIDPAGAASNTPKIAGLLKLPFLGSYLTHVLGRQIVFKGFSKCFMKPENFLDLKEKMKIQMGYLGFKASLLSTLKYFPLNDVKEFYSEVGKAEYPVLLIWGEGDQVTPFEGHKFVLEAIKRVQFHSIPETRHLPLIEKEQVVNTLVNSFLKASN